MNNTILKCKWCGKKLIKKTKEYNRAIKRGQKYFYCGPSCHNFDTKKKYDVIEKVCKCGKSFFTKNGPKEQTFCSRLCSNSFVRRGSNRPEKMTHHISICFFHHKKECVVCKENNAVEVHHYDKNHDNNDVKNLIPLCPTHHAYMHSKMLEKLIKDKIEVYRNNFIKMNQ